MCTVTVVTLPSGGFRVGCSRDESRTRAPADPPVTRRYGPRDAMLPIDGDAGGTWVAANDAGLVLSLLNLNEPPGPDGPPIVGTESRGRIIPDLLHAATVAAVLAEVGRIDPAAQRPFRLVAVDRTERAVVRSDGRRLQIVGRAPNDGPFMVTSSGLGDSVVEGPRRELFESMFAGATTDPVATQEAYHRHHWADRPEVSVSMERADAISRSYTTIHVTDERVAMHHEDGPPHRATGTPADTMLDVRGRYAG